VRLLGLNTAQADDLPPPHLLTRQHGI
jgi:hypothetical protein